MMEIALQPVANQSLTVQLDGARYAFTIKEANGIMVVDVSRDEVLLLSGTRLLAGAALIPYEYLESGNFVMFTENDDLPYYPEFGNSQKLVYLTAGQVAALRKRAA